MRGMPGKDTLSEKEFFHPEVIFYSSVMRMSTPIEELSFMPFVDDDYDIAVGSRGLGDSRILERQPGTGKEWAKPSIYLSNTCRKRNKGY
jgi:hypothetical protein